MVADTFWCLGMLLIKDKSEFRFEYLDEALNPGSPCLPSCAEMQ